MNLSPREFLALIRREDVECKIETKCKRASCRHESAVPTHYARITYKDDVIGEIYRWQGERWIWESFGWV